MRAFFVSILVCFSGCENRIDVETVEASFESPVFALPEPSVLRAMSIKEKLRFSENLRIQLEADFLRPLNSLASLPTKMTSIGKDGLIYQVGVSVPFTGRVTDYHENGLLGMECFYLDGVPHGQMSKRYENGNLAEQIHYRHGVLCGIKFKWREDGRIKIEEYWLNSEYHGKRIWDSQGRLIREEY